MADGIGASLFQIGAGINQVSQANDAIAKLGDYKELNAISEIQDIYEQLSRLSRNPYSPQSTTAFRSALAQGGQNAYSRSVANDPSLAGATLGAVQLSGAEQYAQREMQGDTLRQQYLAQLMGVSQAMQQMDNQNKQAYNQRLLMQEQALGQAKQQGNTKMYQGGAAIGTAGKDIFEMMYGNKIGGGSGQEAEVTQKQTAPSAGGSNINGPYAIDTFESQGTPFLSATDPNYGQVSNDYPMFGFGYAEQPSWESIWSKKR